MKIVLIGIQGAGKSTQGNLLSEELRIPYLSSGHIFREMAKEKTPYGRFMKELLNSGSLVPDDKAVPVIAEYLEKPEYKKGYILDGFPRTVPQAKTFVNGVDIVIYLNVSDKEAVWRLSGRFDEGVREDNTLQAIRQRINLFHEKTKDVLTFYKEAGMLVEIDGEQSVEDIFKQIMDRLKSHEQK
jgi:adenylate kinase